MLKSTPESMARLLIFSGWAVLLLYFPSGLLHSWTGAYVYLRDLLLVMHLFASLVYLGKNGQLNSLLSKCWPLGLVPLFLLPSLFISDIRVEMGGYIKWSFIWLDSIILGRLISQHFSWNRAAVILSILTAMTLLADLGTGFYEWKNNVFAIPMTGQLSPMGVVLGKDHYLVDSSKKKYTVERSGFVAKVRLEAPRVQRIKGLQRDVFSFANLMGMAVVGGICLLISVPNNGVRTAAGAWVCLFSFMLYNSGGRSAFIGVGAAGLLGGGLLLAPEALRSHFSKIVFGWLLIGLFISFFGIGEFTEWFSSHFMSNTAIGNSGSAYDRDVNWQGVRSAIAEVPIVLFTGSSLGSMIDSRVQPVFHWADNNYLWLLYHGSFISLAGLILYFRNALSRPLPSSRLWSKDCLLLFLLYVMGEAIARESLSFLGCIPLFIACGYTNGIRAVSLPRMVDNTETLTKSHLTSLVVNRSHESSPSKLRRKRSDSDSFAARVARQSKQTPPPDP